MMHERGSARHFAVLLYFYSQFISMCHIHNGTIWVCLKIGAEIGTGLSMSLLSTKLSVILLPVDECSFARLPVPQFGA